MHEEINTIDVDHKQHEKLDEKQINRAVSVHDIKRLMDISSQQRLQINRIMEDIHDLRLKTNATYAADSPSNENTRE